MFPFFWVEKCSNQLIFRRKFWEKNFRKNFEKNSRKNLEKNLEKNRSKILQRKKIMQPL